MRCIKVRELLQFLGDKIMNATRETHTIDIPNAVNCSASEMADWFASIGEEMIALWIKRGIEFENAIYNARVAFANAEREVGGRTKY